MKLLAAVLLPTLVGCALFEKEATLEEKKIEVDIWLDWAKTKGAVLVEKGKIKQSELDHAVDLARIGLDAYFAYKALESPDRETRVAARAKLQVALAEFASLAVDLA